MLKKLRIMSLAGAAAAMGAATMIPAAPAAAQSHHRHYRGHHYDQSYRADRYRHRYYNRRAYEKCRDGDGGTIVGAIAGGLLGHEIVGRGDKVLGTIVGGAAGALAGRAIDRSDRPRYCRR